MTNPTFSSIDSDDLDRVLGGQNLMPPSGGGEAPGEGGTAGEARSKPNLIGGAADLLERRW